MEIASKPQSLGEIIRQGRRDSGLKLEELATRIGRSNGYLSHMEHGKRVPSDQTLDLISETLMWDPEKRECALRALTESRKGKKGRGVISNKVLKEIAAISHNLEQRLGYDRFGKLFTEAARCFSSKPQRLTTVREFLLMADELSNSNHVS